MKRYKLNDAYVTFGQLDQLTDFAGSPLIIWRFDNRQTIWRKMRNAIATAGEVLQVIDQVQSNQELVIKLKELASTTKLTYECLGFVNYITKQSPIAAIYEFLDDLNISHVNNAIIDSPMTADTSIFQFIDISNDMQTSLQWFFACQLTNTSLVIHAFRLRLMPDNQYQVVKHVQNEFLHSWQTYRLTVGGCIQQNTIGIFVLEQSFSTAKFIEFDTATESMVQVELVDTNLVPTVYDASRSMPQICLRSLPGSGDYQLAIQSMTSNQMLIQKILLTSYEDKLYCKYSYNATDTITHNITESDYNETLYDGNRALVGFIGDSLKSSPTIESLNIVKLAFDNHNHAVDCNGVPSEIKDNASTYDLGYAELRGNLTAYSDAAKLFDKYDSTGYANCINGNAVLARFWLNQKYGKNAAYFPDEYVIELPKSIPSRTNNLFKVSQSACGVGILLQTKYSTGLENFEGYESIVVAALTDSANAIVPTDFKGRSNYANDASLFRLCYFVDRYNRHISGMQIIRNCYTGCTVLGFIDDKWVELALGFVLYPSPYKSQTVNANGLLENNSSRKGNPLMQNLFLEPSYKPTSPPYFVEPDYGQKFSLSFEPDEGILSHSEGKDYYADSVVVVAANLKANYEFDGWYDNETLLSSQLITQITMPHKDIVISMKTKKIEPTAAPTIAPTLPPTETPTLPPDITVTINPSIGIESVHGAGVYKQGDKILLRASVAAGYRFNGWHINGRLIGTTVSLSYTVPDKDVVIDAMAVQA